MKPESEKGHLELSGGILGHLHSSWQRTRPRPKAKSIAYPIVRPIPDGDGLWVLHLLSDAMGEQAEPTPLS